MSPFDGSSFSIPCASASLDLEHTLACGQTFRWHQDAEGWWACVLTRRDLDGTGFPTLLRLRHEGETLAYQSVPLERGTEAVWDYLRLDVDLTALTQTFLTADPDDQLGIAPGLTAFPGLRVLRQDPVECLFSFLCTSAAPLYRIRRSIAGLCHAYGAPWPDGPVAGITHYAFPTVDRLAAASIEEMQAMGLGYRARYVQATARQVESNGGAAWLLGLRQASYQEAKSALVSLTGVGEKIADCVCLFSLDKDGAIPVDTHIRQIVMRTNSSLLSTQSLTPAAYAQIGDLLRTRYGPYAGWAQQYLFYQDIHNTYSWSAYTAMHQPPTP